MELMTTLKIFNLNNSNDSIDLIFDSIKQTKYIWKNLIKDTV